MPLFHGPTGAASLGRVRAGADAGRLVVMREVPGASAAGLERILGIIEPIAHASITKLLGLMCGDAPLCLVSEYVEGATLFEVMRTSERLGIAVPAAVATRVLHDALVAADQIDLVLGETLKPRYVFSDTIWLAEYGATLISEPGVADALHTPLFARRSFQPTSPELSDTQAIGRLLAQLLLGSSEPAALPGGVDSKLPVEIARIIRQAASHGYPLRRLMAAALAGLPQALLGSEDDVADCVRSLFGVAFEMRRHQATPFDSIRDPIDEADATACVNVSSLTRTDGVASARRPTPGPATSGVMLAPVGVPVTLQSDVGPVPNSAINAFSYDEDDDEQTLAFRPSRIPRPIAPNLSQPAPPATHTGATAPSTPSQSPPARLLDFSHPAELIVINEPTLIVRSQLPASWMRTTVAVVWLLVVALAVWLFVL